MKVLSSLQAQNKKLLASTFLIDWLVSPVFSDN